MSSSIWTRCAGASKVRALGSEPIRVVEAQHQISTRKLVSSDAAQEVLEELIEGAKPPLRGGAKLHYLLFTPFRYPPLPHGSRFGTRFERGIWYGSETLRTVFAEAAYYRLLFLDGTRANLGVVVAQLTTFTVRVHAKRGLDLTVTPFDRYRRLLISTNSYRSTQALGTAMRTADVQAFRYRSARDMAGGINIGVISPPAFGRARPRNVRTWHSTTTRERVEMSARDYFKHESFEFDRKEFLVNGKIPAPSL